MIDDREVIDRILAGDKKALVWFYRTYRGKLDRYITGKIKHPDDAQEIVQDTLFAFLEACRDFQGKASLKTFLFSICQHKIVDYYRRKKLKQVVFSQMPQLEMLVSPLVTPEDEFDKKVVQEKIKNVMASLLPQYQKVLQSKYTEDLSVVEIAKQLALTVKSAESLLFRARKAFVKAFISI